MASRKKSDHQTFAEIRDEAEKTERRQSFESGPRLVHQREWVDASGVRWHRRGGLLDDLHQLRRLRKYPDLIVLHIDGPEGPRQVEGSDASDLLDDVHDFFREPSLSGAEFWVAEFRDEAHRVLLVVDETCW